MPLRTNVRVIRPYRGPCYLIWMSLAFRNRRWNKNNSGVAVQNLTTRPIKNAPKLLNQFQNFKKYVALVKDFGPLAIKARCLCITQSTTGNSNWGKHLNSSWLQNRYPSISIFGPLLFTIYTSRSLWTTVMSLANIWWSLVWAFKKDIIAILGIYCLAMWYSEHTLAAAKYLFIGFGFVVIGGGTLFEVCGQCKIYMNVDYINCIIYFYILIS